MRSLAELQRSMAVFLATPPGTQAPQHLTDAVRRHGPDPQRLLSIYKNNVYVQLVSALAATYPAVLRLVGEEFFRFAAREFIASGPAADRTLVDYGRGFADFLAGFAPAASVPYLADVARLEYLYLQAYHAPEAVPLTRKRFTALAEKDGGIRIALHPSSRLMSSRFPVSRIWELNVSDEPVAEKVRIDGQGEYLLIIRPRSTVEVRRISAAAFAALAALQHGSGLSDAYAGGANSDGEAELGDYLGTLAANDTFIDTEACRHD